MIVFIFVCCAHAHCICDWESMGGLFVYTKVTGSTGSDHCSAIPPLNGWRQKSNKHRKLNERSLKTAHNERSSSTLGFVSLGTYTQLGYFALRLKWHR